MVPERRPWCTDGCRTVFPITVNWETALIHRWLQDCFTHNSVPNYHLACATPGTVSRPYADKSFQFISLIRAIDVTRCPLGTPAPSGRIVQAPDGTWQCSSRWSDKLQRKPKYSQRTCLNATLFTTNPTQIDLGSNPIRCGGRPTTNRLSYDTDIGVNEASCFKSLLAKLLCVGWLPNNTLSGFLGRVQHVSMKSNGSSAGLCGN
jgi:hypothetical protein